MDMFIFTKKPHKQEKKTVTTKSRISGWFKGRSNRDTAASERDDVDGAWQMINKPCPLLIVQSDAEADTSTSSVEARSLLPRQSRLNKTLQDVVNNKHSLPYLIQYLDQHNAGHLIRFWLAAESFAVSSAAKKNVTCRREKHTSATDGKGVTSHDSRSQSVIDLPANSGMSQNVKVESGKWSHGETISLASPESVDSSDGSRVTGRVRILPDEPCQDQSPVLHNHRDECRLDKEVVSSEGSSADPRRHTAQCDYPDSQGSKTEVTMGDESGIETNHRTQLESVGDVLSSRVSGVGCANCGDGLRDKKNLVPDASSQESFKKCVENDAVNIHAKYISKDAQRPIGITEELRNKTIRQICQEDGEVDPDCFRGCCDFVLNIIQREYFADFQSSEYHCQHQIDTLTSTKVLLPDILYCDTAIFYFMEYLEQEGAIALLQCWQDLDSFEQLVLTSGGDSSQLQGDAMVLYDKYFSLQCSCPLGFPDSVRFQVESNICLESGPNPDCFTVAKLIVLKTLNSVYFMHYLSSDVYYKYLSELINTVQLAADMPQTRKKRSESDASSEHSVSSNGSTSISSRNTLLAMNSHQVNRAINRIQDDMRIDSALFNPDSLWKRDQAGSLTLGRINELGQFVSDLHPEPAHDKRGTFFEKLKGKDKTQEDMALQIAMMIVNDVNQATAQATPGDTDT